MKSIIAAFFIAGVGYISGCAPCSTKQITCAAFDEPAFSAWFPYHDSSRMVFKNTLTADTFSYTVEYKNISESYTTSRGGGFESRDRPCGTSAHFSSANYNNSPFGTLLVTYSTAQEVDDGPSSKSLHLSFNNAEWKTGEITDGSFAVALTDGGTGEVATISTSHNMQFDNGITYPEVVILTNDTAVKKMGRAYKLFIAKNIGIIGCEMFPSMQKWVIQ